MSIHGQWSAGSEEDAVQAGVIDALNGGHWRPPTDFPDAYNLGFQDAKTRATPVAQVVAVEVQQLAILGIVHLVMFADRDIDPSEIAWLYEEARYHPVFAGVPFPAFRAACLLVLHDMHERSAEELMEIWVSAARPHARATLELAAGAMLADGRVAPQEEGIVAQLIAKLGITREEATEVFLNAFGIPQQSGPPS
jgi:hypothetical protein